MINPVKLETLNGIRTKKVRGVEGMRQAQQQLPALGRCILPTAACTLALAESNPTTRPGALLAKSVHPTCCRHTSSPRAL